MVGAGPAGPGQRSPSAVQVCSADGGRRVDLTTFNQQKTIAVVGVLDTTTNKIIATIPVRPRPFVAAVTPDGKRLYVPTMTRAPSQ